MGSVSSRQDATVLLRPDSRRSVRDSDVAPSGRELQSIAWADGRAHHKSSESLAGSTLFPFDGEFVLKTIAPPVAAELVRDGEGEKPCHSCGKDDRVLWRNDHWKVTSVPRSINPVGLFLETIEASVIDANHLRVVVQLAAAVGGSVPSR